MQTRTRSNRGYGNGGNDLGKSILVSFPAHEIHLIDELDRLAHLEMTSKSQFLRRCIRREAKKAEEQIGRRYTTA
mgnify:FL=1